MRTVRIDASKRYDVIIGKGLLAEAGNYITGTVGRCSCMLVSDDLVFSLYGEKVRDSIERSGCRTDLFTFPHGEESKNLEVYGRLLEEMSAARMTRSDIVIALGGGVTGDLAGFAAATYQRGIRYVQLPTTLLAMVDSSVGGKTAVDLRHGKNMAGAFCQPSLVLCDTGALSTLPPEEFSCGAAEVIKYAMIESGTFFRSLEEKDISEQAESVVASCVEMKSRYVMRDEYDTGDRMLLNFGHTIGHAVEACSGFKVLHGQGVAMGMSVMTRAAVRKGYCEPGSDSRLDSLLVKNGLPVSVPFKPEQLIDTVLSDKKARGGFVRIVVPRKIGNCFLTDADREDMLSWMRDGGMV